MIAQVKVILEMCVPCHLQYKVDGNDLCISDIPWTRSSYIDLVNNTIRVKFYRRMDFSWDIHHFPLCNPKCFDQIHECLGNYYNKRLYASD